MFSIGSPSRSFWKKEVKTYKYIYMDFKFEISNINLLFIENWRNEP